MFVITNYCCLFVFISIVDVDFVIFVRFTKFARNLKKRMSIYYTTASFLLGSLSQMSFHMVSINLSSKIPSSSSLYHASISTALWHEKSKQQRFTLQGKWVFCCPGFFVWGCVPVTVLRKYEQNVKFTLLHGIKLRLLIWNDFLTN